MHVQASDLRPSGVSCSSNLVTGGNTVLIKDTGNHSDQERGAGARGHAHRSRAEVREEVRVEPREGRAPQRPAASGHTASTGEAPQARPFPRALWIPPPRRRPPALCGSAAPAPRPRWAHRAVLRAAACMALGHTWT